MRADALVDVPAPELEFRFVTDRISLALTATVGERWGRRIERLRRPTDLERWFVSSGLTTRAPRVDEGSLLAGRVLREAIYDAAQSVRSNQPPRRAALLVINRSARAEPLVPQLRSAGISWLEASITGESALSTVARDAIDLLAGGDATRVRECASPTCGLLFTDASRPGTRRWCSSERCGGTARSAQYRRRHG